MLLTSSTPCFSQGHWTRLRRSPPSSPVQQAVDLLVAADAASALIHQRPPGTIQRRGGYACGDGNVSEGEEKETVGVSCQPDESRNIVATLAQVQSHNTTLMEQVNRHCSECVSFSETATVTLLYPRLPSSTVPAVPSPCVLRGAPWLQPHFIRAS